MTATDGSGTHLEPQLRTLVDAGQLLWAPQAALRSPPPAPAPTLDACVRSHVLHEGRPFLLTCAIGLSLHPLTPQNPPHAHKRSTACVCACTQTEGSDVLSVRWYREHCGTQTV